MRLIVLFQSILLGCILHVFTIRAAHNSQPMIGFARPQRLALTKGAGMGKRIMHCYWLNNAQSHHASHSHCTICDPLHDNESDVAQCIIKLWTVLWVFFIFIFKIFICMVNLDNTYLLGNKAMNTTIL